MSTRIYAQWTVRLLSAFDATTQAALLALLLPQDQPRGLGSFLVVLLVVPLSQCLLRRFGLYDSHRVDGGGKLVRMILGSQLICFSIVAFFSGGLGIGNDFRVFVVYFSLSTAFLSFERAFIYFVLQRMRRHGYDSRNVCLVGSWQRAREMADHFSQNPQWGLQVVCRGDVGPDTRQFFDLRSENPIGSDLENVLKTYVVDEVLIAVPPESLPSQDQLIRLCERYGLTTRVIFDPSLGERGASQLENFHGSTTLSVGYPRRSERLIALKRLFDLALSGVMLVLASPVLLLIAITVKLSSPGPIIFKQIRVGLNGRKFFIFKFRTMIDGAESLVQHTHRSITKGPAFKDVQDYRITEVGRMLRRFSLDELPQLFNVLKGDMSLVGPRPLPAKEADEITGENRRRFSMRPGITCLWQVNGRSDVEFDRWMKYDLEYVDRWSLWSDAVLLFRTIPAVLSGRGAY